jgi:hypothetical protein
MRSAFILCLSVVGGIHVSAQQASEPAADETGSIAEENSQFMDDVVRSYKAYQLDPAGR